MNIRRHLAAFLAGTAATCSLTVGLTAQAAHAQNCETAPDRSLYVADVKVSEGNPIGLGLLTPAKFSVVSFGCMNAGTVQWHLAPALASEPGDMTDSNDMVYKSGTLTWAKGETGPKVITAHIIRDLQPENDEKFKLIFHAKSGLIDTKIGAVATGTVVDDDTPPPA